MVPSFGSCFRTKTIYTERVTVATPGFTPGGGLHANNVSGKIVTFSTHDIIPENLDACLTVITKLLEAGNNLLIVSKPHLDCIQELCRNFSGYKDKILFRFTIGATDDKILSFWEPGAPTYGERKESLRYAFEQGFETSVSVEPMLDSDNIGNLVEDLAPYVTDSIWIGKMNKISTRVDITSTEIEDAVKAIEVGQTDAKIKAIYEILKDNPKVKWKDSIKEVVGLEKPTEAGLDV